MARRLVIWGIGLVAVVFLAFLLQSTVQDLCIVPAIELLRMVGLFLRSVPQAAFWGLLVACVAFIALGSLAGAAHLHFWRAVKEKQTATPGPIGRLAEHIHNTRRGVYFKWLVAHRLAELEQAVVIQSGDLRPEGLRGMKAEGNAGQRAVDIQAYTEAGLDRPPKSHPRRRFLSRRPPSPLDLDPGLVVEYLESQMEPRE